MTCTCKAELASILRKQASVNNALGTLDTDLSPVRRVLAKTLSDLAARLCPQAEPVPTGLTTLTACYCSKCGHLMPWAHKRSIDLLPLCAGCQLAASEPGVSAKDSSAKTDSAPAVAFDAEKWAETMVRPIVVGGLAGLHELDGGGYCAFYQDDASNQARINHARQIIAAALRAAESAGYARAKAEQTPSVDHRLRRYPDEQPQDGQICYIRGRTHWPLSPAIYQDGQFRPLKGGFPFGRPDPNSIRDCPVYAWVPAIEAEAMLPQPAAPTPAAGDDEPNAQEKAAASGEDFDHE